MRIVVMGLVVLVLGVGLGQAGVWEPGELVWAEHARAVSTRVFGADALEPDGRSVPMPTRDTLGHGELATDASALGFRVLGLSERSGRIPIALFGLLGILASMALVRSLADDRTALYAGLVLVTMPAYFAPARSMCTDVPTMAAIVLATAGLAIGTRVSVTFGVLGLALGFLARGALFGVALPLLSVAVTALIVGQFGFIARASAVAGVLALGLGVVALSTAPTGLLPLALGVTKTALPAPHPSFDATLSEIGHGAFPWSAIVPVALFAKSEGKLAVLAVVGAALSYAAHAFTSDVLVRVPFLGLPFLAIAIAIAFRNWEKQGRVPPLASVCVASLLLLLVLDFTRFPEKALVALGAPAALPGRALAPLVLLFVVAGGVAGLSTLVAALAKRRGAHVWFVGALAAACFVRFVAHPRLGELLSPRAAFSAFRDRQSGEARLAVLGISQKAALYSGIAATATTTPNEALDFLGAKNAFLALPLERLPEVNALHRSRFGGNLTIVDARSPSALLAGTLAAGERDQSPLAGIVLDHLPEGTVPLDFELGKRVKTSGIAIHTRGARHFEVAIYYEVLAKGLGGHCTFLHVDKSPTRHSVEHRDWPEYPLALWQPGDIIQDSFDVRLPPSFARGRYALWFGFGVMPCEDDRRLGVTRGSAEDNRVLGGFIEVP